MKKLVLALAAAASFPLATHAAEPETEAVEYYNTATRHYFITATAGEARVLDDGLAGPGWVRTGRSFQAWLDAAKAPPSATGVCRFYSRGANSHFYTGNAAECEYLKGLEAAERRAGGPVMGWQYEGIAFHVETPEAARCAPGTTPVSRLYNDGFANGEGANHRFVDDPELRALMIERAWIAEDVAFCSRTKPSGTNANLPPTTTNFEPLVAGWSGAARWTKGAGGTEMRASGPIALDIVASGAVSGGGRGCRFQGQVQRGDGFRSLFEGTMSAAGCDDAAFDGAYSRFSLERFGNGTLAVRLKKGDGATEASIEAVLSAAASTTPPSTSPSGAGIAGDWAGTVGWSIVRRVQGVETTLVTSNRALSIVIDAAGALSGSGFGCAFAGTLSATTTAGLFSGTATATGCTEGGFNRTFADVKVAREDGRLEIEFESESESAGVTTKARIEGSLARGAAAPTNPTGPSNPGTPVTPPAGIAGNYQGAFTADVEVRNRANGNAVTTTSSSSTLRFSLGADGALSGSGFGCSLAGQVALASAAQQLWTGSVSATGCTDAALSGTYAASAHREDGGAVQLELEREAEAGGVRTKVKIRGTASRTGN